MELTGDQTGLQSTIMFSILQATVVMCWICLLSNGSSTYELQDTIHTLKEENLHLQHQLENLTRALGDLRHLLMEHPGGRRGTRICFKCPRKAFKSFFFFLMNAASGGVHDPEYLHAWREWTQHGKTS